MSDATICPRCEESKREEEVIYDFCTIYIEVCRTREQDLMALVEEGEDQWQDDIHQLERETNHAHPF